MTDRLPVGLLRDFANLAAARSLSARARAWHRSKNGATRLAELGVSHVVSFIGDDEVEDYGLSLMRGLANWMRAISVSHISQSLTLARRKNQGYRDLVLGIFEKLKSGENIFAHCAGGVGRAGTFASCLLVTEGMNADEAMQLVSKQRGMSSPETEGQRAFVRSFAP